MSIVERVTMSIYGQTRKGWFSNFGSPGIHFEIQKHIQIWRRLKSLAILVHFVFIEVVFGLLLILTLFSTYLANYFYECWKEVGSMADGRCRNVKKITTLSTSKDIFWNTVGFHFVLYLVKATVMWNGVSLKSKEP